MVGIADDNDVPSQPSDDSVGSEPKKKTSVLETLGRSRKKELKKHPVPWWIAEDDSDDGIRGTSGSFLKSQRLSHPILEVDEDNAESAQLPQATGISVSLSRDSLETNDSVVASGPNENLLGIGLDTLEEQEEKERFFANLEKGVSSTIDYSRLNKALDSNDSEVLQAFLRDHSGVKQMEEGNEDEQRNHEKSGDYSEDFEDSESKEDNKVEQAVTSEANEEKTGMLAKVVLLDSQDSAVETQKVSEQEDVAVTEHHLPQEIAADEMNGTAVSGGRTNSDIEALHQAYFHVEHSLGDTDEQRIPASCWTMEMAQDSLKDASQNREESPKNTSITDSDLPTVEELMKPLRADSSFARGYDLEPASSVNMVHSVDELVSHLPLKEHQNDSSLEKQNISCPLGQHNVQGVVSVQTRETEGSFHHGASKDNQAEKIKHDPLEQNVSQNSSVVHQDIKTIQVHSLNKEDLESVINKQVMHKNMKTTDAVHKKKSLSGPYSFVRSSGYGRSSSPLKHSTTVNEKKVLNEGIRKPALKAKSPARSKVHFAASDTTAYALFSIWPYSTGSVYEIASRRVVPLSISVSTLLYHDLEGREHSVGRRSQYDRNCLIHRRLPRTNTGLLMNEIGLTIILITIRGLLRLSGTTMIGFITLNVSSHSPSRNSGRELYLFKRVQEAEGKLAVAHDLIHHLKAASLQKEKEMEAKIMEMKMLHERDFFQLNQEKYVLQTQLNSREDLNKGVKWTDLWERIPDGGEMLKEIQKEVQNQETLLQGYQQENERLYQQVKELQINNKKNEGNMFKENQRLMTELASLREQLDKNNLLSHGVQNSEPTGNQSFTDLILELRAAKAAETNLLEERKRLKQDKQALEVDLEQAKKERDLARAQIAATSDAKSCEMRIMEESYKEEIGRLQKRLQWYAENQELLDKDAARLRGAKIEIDKLKQEVDQLRMEAGNQLTQQKKGLKDRAADAKRIQDLERQVKEMEGILKRRHPNSLPALIYAAATASSDGGGDASSKTNTVDFLERRIKKLEAELEGKDDDCKKSLRTMEQQFQKIKHQYEKRVNELEQLLAYKLQDDPQELQDRTGSLAALEEELHSVNKAHQITVKNLQAEIDSLSNQIAQMELQKKVTEDADIQSLEFQVEQAHAKAKWVRLNQDLVAKNREIQDLTRTVERLQKERRIMLSHKDSGGQIASKEKPSGNVKKVIFDSKDTGNGEFFPGTLDDKIYQPSAFADSHISEVLQENAQLKNELEKMTLELSQQRAKSEAGLANSESVIRRSKEDSEEYIAALKASHQKEMEKILRQHAVEHSTSKVAQLNSKISTQEVLIKHLQQQLHELRRDQEALKVSQMREEILQKEMGKLLEELREAKESQRPEMKHFVCLDRKIRQLEARYEQREQELQQVIQHTRHTAEVEQTQEIEKWRKLALLKNQELEKFRIELDSMLDVLRQLQKQGVIIPAGGSNIHESYWKI
ncbi:PREDICTED: LOW QUALITY PROTEIN: centrosomal protein of 162 kDa [Gekko japonicus]|uniref:Centrosomal protein of 162 kDa n=1 Tax=Gekko japonicus TaxID=146911 RepID=A0ABM1LBW2_GEKJA|nr:PREDICTED: LOW QUALITY PROTEIN: centrosomal protein of 162 kDa [Gekko japonicus]